jgi:hypothetical protein
MGEAGMSGDTEDRTSGSDQGPVPVEPAGVLARAVAIGVRATWVIGSLALAGIAGFSLIQLGRYAVQSLSGIDAGRMAWIGAGLLVAAALWAAIIWNRGPIRTHQLAIGLVAVLVTRLIDVVLVPAPLVSDFLTYHNLGVQISQSGPTLASVPAGYPMALGIVYRLFGPQPVYAQLLNCLIAVATAALVYDLARRLWDDSAARWALWLFALAPAQILMTSVLASEAPYGLLLMLALWGAIALKARPLLAAAAVGLFLAASNYVRATSPALIPAFAVLPFAALSRLRAGIAWVGVLVVVFLAVLSPVIQWNAQQGAVSVSPSHFGGWSLLVGTDPTNDGRYNADLIELVGGTPGTPDFDNRAGKIAIERLKAKPIQFLELAVRKFPTMWALDDYGVRYTVGTTSNTNATDALLLLSQATYLAIVALALAGLWRIRAAVPPLVTTMVLIMLALVLVHSFLEVEPRYHAYMVPIFCVLAGPAAAALRDGGFRGLSRPAARV